MQPAELIPAAEAIPAPWWVFDALGVLTLVLHLLLMNLVLGGSLLSTWRVFRPSARVPDLTKQLPVGFALAINLGVAPLLFVQVTYGQFVYVSSVLIGVFWLSVIPALILAYYGAYGQRYGAGRAVARYLSPITSVLLLLIAFVYVNNMTLMLEPERWAEYAVNRDGTMLNVSAPIFWPRFLHMVLAAVAIAPLWSSLLKAWKARKSAAKPDHTDNLRIFAWATALQLGVGLWHLLSMRDDVVSAFLGGNLVATAVLWLGVLSGVGAMMSAFRGRLRPTVSMLLGTVVLMVIARALVRSAYLGELFDVTDLELAFQASPLVLFLVTFVLGLGVIWWLVKTFLKATPDENEEVAS